MPISARPAREKKGEARFCPANPSLSDTPASFISFFEDRLTVQLREQRSRHDLVNAVLAAGSLVEGNRIVSIVDRVGALGTFLDTDDGKNLLAGTKRAANILRIEEKKDNQLYDEGPDT